jgi:hypothetical protein
VVLVSCSSVRSDSSGSQSQNGVIPTPNSIQNSDSQPVANGITINLEALNNSITASMAKIESIKTSISESTGQFADLIVEYQYQIKCGTSNWPRWLVPNYILENKMDLKASIVKIDSESIIEVNKTINEVSNEIDVCKTNTGANDYYVLEHRDRVDKDYAWNDFADPGYKDIFVKYVPQLKNLFSTCQCWNWNDPGFNSTYEGFQTEWASRFSQRSTELRTRLNDVVVLLESKFQELSDVNAELESATDARSAAESMMTSTTKAAIVQAVPSIRADSLLCEDGMVLAYCQVLWSDGRYRPLPYGVGPRQGGVVDAIIYYDLQWNPSCILLFADGSILTSYDTSKCY